MSNIYDWLSQNGNTNFKRERAMERPLEAFSRRLWPWPESKLIILVTLLMALDYISTFAFLTFGKNPQVVEGGLLAGWALHTGGFFKLFIVDTIVVGGLVLLSLSARYIYSRLGFPGLGRTALVFLLVPYFIVTIAVVYNNIFWALF